MKLDAPEAAQDGQPDNNSGPSLRITELVEKAARLLPSQGPIDVFVHHNTLHAYEHQTFHQAVRAGLHRFGGQPYLSEAEYRRLYSAGRIRAEDIESILSEELGRQATQPIAGLASQLEIRLAMLSNPVHAGLDAELKWIVAETDALDRFCEETSTLYKSRSINAAKKVYERSRREPDSIPQVDCNIRGLGRDSSGWKEREWEAYTLHLLWRVCLQGAAQATNPLLSDEHVRPRDILFRRTGHDIDPLVQEELIRFSAAYVDQGYSDWQLPGREAGYFQSFVQLYCESGCCTDRRFRKLSTYLETLRRRNATATEVIDELLLEFGVEQWEREEFIIQSLLSLRGWAGMVWQLESEDSSVVHSICEGSLVGYLAVQLILEKVAVEHFANKESQALFPHGATLAEILEAAKTAANPLPRHNPERQAFLLFQVAQMLGWTSLELLELDESEWRDLGEEINGFSELERRRVFHEAYECKYRHAALDAFATHSVACEKRRLASGSDASFQFLTCIDDREESLRRHLEEVQPSCETFGAAGFFAVAMQYKGAAEGFYRPLCPGVITPRHYVQEDVGYTFEGQDRSRAQLRKGLGLARHVFSMRSRTFFGGIVAGIGGTAASIPLVARVLFPRFTARVRRRFGSLLQPPPVTNLQLERSLPSPGPENGHIGYTVDEMADVVTRLLQDIGITQGKEFSRLFVVCGHGSSSLNNPHESAYCCGACAGKRGGPNARAFAQMANDWRVRAKVAERGIAIPDETRFVGAYHNTCSDSVVFYDLDRLSTSHRRDFEFARDALDEARRRNAQERCRRFESVALGVSAGDALRHVEARAQDISQARPEYNHATNALCVVGRRSWSRGLFLDRRAFLSSYDPSKDDAEHSVLQRSLAAVIPVCAGINLEYFFSCVDHSVYGSGSKLPHNIVSLLGVMEGTASDLRTGLYQQMVEIHEPLRITFLIESTAGVALSIMKQNAAIDRLVRGSWIHLAVIEPATGRVQEYRDGKFRDREPNCDTLPQRASSHEFYCETRDNLPLSQISDLGAAK